MALMKVRLNVQQFKNRHAWTLPVQKLGKKHVGRRGLGEVLNLHSGFRVKNAEAIFLTTTQYC